MRKKIIAIIITTFMSTITSANADSAVQALLNCDSTFFKEIKNIPDLQNILNKLDKTVIESQSDISIPVKYTSPEGIKITKFTISYSNFDEFKKLGIKGPQGKYYYWGFETPQSMSQVANILSKNNQLIKDGEVYIYNPMIRFGKNGKWQSNKTAASGTTPGKEITEKVTIIEKKSNGVSINCSLQGNVSKKDLIAAGLHKK